jgi:hypothetical protein
MSNDNWVSALDIAYMDQFPSDEEDDEDADDEQDIDVQEDEK